jgi:2-polyprenyl-3-methyl-5-hydroxy-6-metoxy-1,4-benzoquinol methylase
LLKNNITSEESMQENLDTWCYEVGSRFEQASVAAVRDFNLYAIFDHVADIGCGDGAASLELENRGFEVDAVDINEEKLNKIKEKNIFIKIKKQSAIEYLNSIDALDNFFSHHSLEHMIDAEEIIQLAGQKLKPRGIYYVIVPAGDYLHSVHHVVFERAEELLPVGLEPILIQEQERFGEKEFICVATKMD